MGHLWGIAQDHLDRYGVRSAALARKMGTGPQTLNSWKNRGVRKLPDRELLAALSRETGTPYVRVVEAALRDAGYLAEESLSGHQPAATTPARGSRAIDERDLAVVLAALETYFDRADLILQKMARSDHATMLTELRDELRGRLRHDLSVRLAEERPDSARDVG